MTNEKLEEYIEIYNSGKWTVPMSSFQISPNVEVAQVWDRLPTGEVCNEESYRFFFIKNEIECVAIVLEMDTYDIHWLVSKKYRKQGYLYKALRDSILPFLFDDERTEQRASANTYDNAAYLLRQGFKKRVENGQTAYYLSGSDVNEYDESHLQRCPLSIDELKKVKHELRRIAGEARIVRDKLECAYGHDGGLNEIASRLCSYALDLEFIFDTP